MRQRGPIAALPKTKRLGHDSNHDRSLGAVLDWVPEASIMLPRRPVSAGLETKRLGNGAVQRAAMGALAAADRVLTVAEVQVAVEERLGMPVSKDSVRSCLSSGARSPHPRFERTAPGCYRLTRSI
jgi:hypothetical protein